MRLSPSQRLSGTTFSEVIMAVVLLAVFVTSVFELNAVCLRYIDASKDSIAAQQVVQDRAEVLRNIAFPDLTSTSYVQALLASPANGSDLARGLTEIVRISQYPTANGTTQFTRDRNGTVTQDSTATDLGSSLVQVSVIADWNMTFGGRARKTETTTIVSNGTKK